MPKEPTKYLELRGLMRSKGISIKELAEEIGMSNRNLSAKLNGTVRLHWEDVQKISDYLDIPPKRLRKVFAEYPAEQKAHAGRLLCRQTWKEQHHERL